MSLTQLVGNTGWITFWCLIPFNSLYCKADKSSPSYISSQWSGTLFTVILSLSGHQLSDRYCFLEFAAQGMYWQEPEKEMDLWNLTWLLVLQASPRALYSKLTHCVSVCNGGCPVSPCGQELKACTAEVKKTSCHEHDNIMRSAPCSYLKFWLDYNILMTSYN